MKPYKMIIYPIFEGGTIEWAVEFPDLPGCVAGGDTIEEATAMAKDALKAWLEARKTRRGD